MANGVPVQTISISVPSLVADTGGTVGTDQGQTITGPISVASGSTIGLRVNQNSGSSVVINGGAAATQDAWMFVQRVN